jgi:hypothetical protein
MILSVGSIALLERFRVATLISNMATQKRLHQLNSKFDNQIVDFGDVISANGKNEFAVLTQSGRLLLKKAIASLSMREKNALRIHNARIAG